jgi:hypothetical protein
MSAARSPVFAGKDGRPIRWLIWRIREGLISASSRIPAESSGNGHPTKEEPGRPLCPAGPALRSGEVEPVEVHDLVPRGHEISCELVVRVIARVDL